MNWPLRILTAMSTQTTTFANGSSITPPVRSTLAGQYSRPGILSVSSVFRFNPFSFPLSSPLSVLPGLHPASDLPTNRVM